MEASDYQINSYEQEGGRLFAKSTDNLDNQRFLCNQSNAYMFARKEDNRYEIRKLSKTSNANVIFSVDRKEDSLSGMKEEDFIKYLCS